MCTLKESNLSLCLTHGHPVFPTPCIKGAAFFQHLFFSLFQISVIRYPCVLVFCFIPLVHMSTFVPVPYWFYYYSSIIYPEVWNGTLPVLFSLFRIALALTGVFCCHMNFEFLKIFVKYIWIFDWDYIEYINCFW